jgi:small subunit ribosomal protein S2
VEAQPWSLNMSNLTMAAMIKAAVYFGHRKSFLCPAMKPMIYSIHDGMHIINLEKTLPLFEEALEFIDKLIYNQGEILIVGTKRAAQPLVKKYASECGMPYIDKRWLGGTLTNFKTIKRSVKRLLDLTDMIEQGLPENLTKKEKLSIMREQGKLNASLGGIKDMSSLPDALFVIDIGAEKIAVAEARRLGIPVIGIVDTNCSPLNVDFPIPGNDDARRAIDLYLSNLTDVITKAKAKIAGELAVVAAANEKDQLKTYTKKAVKKPDEASTVVSTKKDDDTSAAPAVKKAAAPKVVKKTKASDAVSAPVVKAETVVKKAPEAKKAAPAAKAEAAVKKPAENKASEAKKAPAAKAKPAAKKPVATKTKKTDDK